MAETPRPILANVTRLHHSMDHAGWAAVVVRSGTNFTYLAGFAYPGTLARHLDFPDSPREVLLLWPRHGEPVMVLNHYAAPLARRDSWLQRIEVYDDYAESPYERVAALLRQMGLHADTIGMEKTYVSAARWEEMQRLVPGARLVDCTALMAQVRWVKTPGEIQSTEGSCRLSWMRRILTSFPRCALGRRNGTCIAAWSRAACGAERSGSTAFSTPAAIRSPMGGGRDRLPRR